MGDLIFNIIKMNINYYSKNYEIGDEVKKYIEEGISKFSKYANDSESIKSNIKIEKTKHQNYEDAFILAIELEIDGNGYFAEKSAPSVFKSFDDCEDAIDAVIRRGKEKDISDKKRSVSTKEIELKEY